MKSRGAFEVNPNSFTFDKLLTKPMRTHEHESMQTMPKRRKMPTNEFMKSAKASFSFHPSPEGKIGDGWKHRLPAYAAIYVVWIAFVFFMTDGTKNPFDWHFGWNTWDAQWYQKIWAEGYASFPRMLVFPPLFSLLTGSLSAALTLSFPMAALVLNLSCFFYGGVTLSEMLSHRFRVPSGSLFLFFLSAPGAYFAFAPYSDALFIALFSASLAFALRPQESLSLRQKITGGLLLFITPWSRLTGYSLGIWFLLKRWYAASVVLALAGWLALNNWIGGEPFYFLKAQKLFEMPEGNFIDGLTYTVKNFAEGPLFGGPMDIIFWIQFHLLPLFLLGSLLATAAWLAKRKEWLLALTIVSVAIFSHNQSFWRSAVRYDLPLEIFLALPILNVLHAPACKRVFKWLAGLAFVALIIGGFIAQIYFARLFRAGQWAF